MTNAFWMPHVVSPSSSVAKAEPFVNRYAIFVLGSEDEAVRRVGESLSAVFGKKYAVSFEKRRLYDYRELVTRRTYTTDKGKRKEEENTWDYVTLKNYGAEVLLTIECFDQDGDLLEDEFMLAYHLAKVLFWEAPEEKK